MSKFEEYRSVYPNVAFSRDDGIITLRLHSDGGILKWGALSHSIHAQLGSAFRDVALDGDNRVMILSGTGDEFCTEMALDEVPPPGANEWFRIMREGRDLLLNFLEITIPVVSVLNGPVSIHAELPVMADIVLAANDAYVQDAAHILGGIVPGDGVQTIWMDLLGPNRARHFLFTGAQLDSATLLQTGVVAEVLPRDELTPRANAVATQLAALPRLTARYTRMLLTHRMKRRLTEELQFGLSVEGLSIAALNQSSSVTSVSSD